MGRIDRRAQRGLLTLDALVFSSFIFVMLGIFSFVLREYNLQRAAVEAGNWGTQVTFAVRAAIADQGPSIIPGTNNGLDWLKLNTVACGGSSAKPYLHLCDFPDSTTFGMDVATDIAVSGSQVTATITIGPMDRAYEDDSGNYRINLLQQVARTINQGELIDPSLPVANTYYQASVDQANGTVVVETTNDTTVDIYIRADGTKAWDNGVTQDVNQASFENTGDITGDAAVTPTLTMSDFIDADDTDFLLDPDDTDSRINAVSIADDVYLEYLDSNPADAIQEDQAWLSNNIIQFAGIVNQGDAVPKPTCPRGTQEIHGSVAGIVATDNPPGNTGTYGDPKNLKGFTVYAVDGGAVWNVFALAFIDDPDAGNELQPPTGLGLVRINVFTKCAA